jgi:hypothetical protein
LALLREKWLALGQASQGERELGVSQQQQHRRGTLATDLKAGAVLGALHDVYEHVVCSPE